MSIDELLKNNLNNFKLNIIILNFQQVNFNI